MKSWPFDSPLDDPTREACGWIGAARAEWDEDDLNLVGHVHAANEPAPVLPPGPYSVDRGRASYPVRSRSADPAKTDATPGHFGELPDAA